VKHPIDLAMGHAHPLQNDPRAASLALLLALGLVGLGTQRRLLGELLPRMSQWKNMGNHRKKEKR